MRRARLAKLILAGPEERIKFLAKQYPDLQLTPELTEQLVRDLATADPTATQKHNPLSYLHWIVRAWRNKGFRWPEDSDRIREALTLFDKVKKRLPQEQRDILRVKTLHNLEDLVERFENVEEQKSQRQVEREIKVQGARKLYDDGEYQVIEVTTPEAACFYGKGTKWCTSGSYHARNYLRVFSRIYGRF
jgi:hypothetical protein